MTRNHLVICGAHGAGEPAVATFVARLAACSGSDVGLVHTGVAPAQLKASGGRIEAERHYGGLAVSAFDEPLGVGSAVAQLAGHADAVIVDRLDDWAARLVAQHPDDQVSIDAELTSLRSVMNAHLLDLFLLSGRPGDTVGAVDDLARRILQMAEPLCAVEVDATGAAPRVVRGSLPG